MTKRKYIKNSKGVTMSVTTDTLGLEKPLLNENYDIDVHNRNMDKIDEDLKPIDDSYIIELFQHDGDTTNPRDYYTKVEADEKFASKEEVEKFATKEEVENIDLSNLATKEEANNALNKANEAFQRGDNVKTQLVDKLISEGLNVSTNNTFEELIGNIALGKKWAIGNSKAVQDTYAGSAFRGLNVNVSSLGFKPSIIICMQVDTSSVEGDYVHITLYIKNLSKYYVDVNVCCTLLTGRPSDLNYCSVTSKISDTNYRLYNRAPVGAKIDWIAIE